MKSSTLPRKTLLILVSDRVILSTVSGRLEVNSPGPLGCVRRCGEGRGGDANWAERRDKTLRGRRAERLTQITQCESWGRRRRTGRSVTRFPHPPAPSSPVPLSFAKTLVVRLALLFLPRWRYGLEPREGMNKRAMVADGL